MADIKITVSWRDWLFHRLIAAPLNFLFTTHRKTTCTAIIVMAAAFALALCFPPFIPALIAFKLINFAPFAFMAALSIPAQALTTSGLAGGATVLVIKALYLAQLAISTSITRIQHYFNPQSPEPPKPVTKAYTMQALFDEFQRSAQLGRVHKVTKTNREAPIDSERLVLFPKEGAEQKIAIISASATPADILSALTMHGHSIFKKPKKDTRQGRFLSATPRDDTKLTTQIINTSFTY